MDGFRVTVAGDRLVVSEPWSGHILDWLILGLSLTAIAALVAGAVAAGDYVTAVVCAFFVAAPLYLFEVSHQKRFAFDRGQHTVLRGRKPLCGTASIEAIVVDESTCDSPVFRVELRCTDGACHVLGEYATEASAVHLATSISDHTGIPVRFTSMI